MSAEQQLIEQLAYRLWQEAGSPDGRDQEFWFQAEIQLSPVTSKAAPKAAAKPKTEKAPAKPRATAAKPKAPAKSKALKA